jgi:protein-L-isoaspartate(D-aspartate) O-methyltransferase
VTGARPRNGRFPLQLDRLGGAERRPASGLLRPQRPVHEAAAETARLTPPSGLGLDSSTVRQRMVARVRAHGGVCEPVLAAMAEVPRHLFVDSALATQAYEDTSLPIGWEQTISKPTVVARMLSLLFDSGAARARGSLTLGRVLEIGTGCGYQAALLGRLATNVVSVERLHALHQKARELLDFVGAANVRLVYGDGRIGHAPNAPYDAIISAAGGDDLPQDWLEQLSIGGRLVAPMHRESDGGQVLMVVDRTPDGLRQSVHDAVHFVPLKSGRL